MRMCGRAGVNRLHLTLLKNLRWFIHTLYRFNLDFFAPHFLRKVALWVG